MKERTRVTHLWTVSAVAIYINLAGSAPTPRDTHVSHLPLIYGNTSGLIALERRVFCMRPCVSQLQWPRETVRTILSYLMPLIRQVQRGDSTNELICKYSVSCKSIRRLSLIHIFGEKVTHTARWQLDVDIDN